MKKITQFVINLSHSIEMKTDLKINGDRLRASLEEMAKIGATPAGGVQRLTLTDLDRQARDLLISWLKAIDCEVTVDAMGCIFGRYKGFDSSLPPVMSGSHVDSQPKGGRFDGILGVMGALEVLRTLHDNKITPLRPIVIVDWTNEEGSRFAPAMVASGVWAGALDMQKMYLNKDKDGKVFGEELERIGYKGKVPCQKFPAHAYYELHIEQGPMLEKMGKVIAAPKGIKCLHWYDVYIEGAANQVGPTPMAGRNDALCAAADIVLAVEGLPAKFGDTNGEDLVATVGEIQCGPNSRNIIPDKVHLTVDIRSWDDELALRCWEDLEKTILDIERKRGTPMKTVVTWRVKHAAFDKSLMANVMEGAAQFGYPAMEWVSGAGHDASYMNQVMPTAMVFVPSINGRSHVECECTKWEDCAAGANVLLHCLLKSANEK